MRRIIGSSREIAVTAMLLVMIGVFYAYPKQDAPILGVKLDQLPSQAPGWLMLAQYPIEPEVQKVLLADDTLSRVYQDTSTSSQVSFFVAYFRTQTTGVAPHSPRNCLPGAGWVLGSPRVVAVSSGGSHALVIAWRSTTQKIAS